MSEIFTKLIGQDEVAKKEIKTTFKLPIQYSPHHILNDELLKDIEFCGGTEDNKFNCLLQNSNSFNFLIDEYTKYYSTSKSYLKDTQKLCLNLNLTDYDRTNFSHNTQNHLKHTMTF